MARARKRSKDSAEMSEIFSDLDFDADEFVDEMENKSQPLARSGSSWRRLEQLREERMLQRELSDFDSWGDPDAADR